MQMSNGYPLNCGISFLPQHKCQDINLSATIDPETVTVSVVKKFEWAQGNPREKFIVQGENIFCFLTKITGKFEGGGESLEVVEKSDGWYFRGSSNQQGVAGTAVCVELHASL